MGRMSLDPSNIVGVYFPLKSFIKEGNRSEEPLVKKINNELGFKALEAKIAYDEAISQNFKSQDNDEKHGASKTVNCQRNKKKLRANVKESLVKNVSVNSVFKAIEQEDMSFLETNLHPGNVNMLDGFGWTPLMSAAYAGNLNIVQFLLKLGAKKKMRNKSGLTAVQLASKSKFTNVVELLEREFKPNDRLENTDGSSMNNCSKNSATDVDTKETSRRHNSSLRNNFYCSVCRSEYKDTALKEHESSIVHIFNMTPKVPEAHYVVPKGSKGYQMLINSGWDEEHGLGPSGEGRKYPIKTTLKQDRKGLGLEKSIAKVTHFKPGNCKAIKLKRSPNERTLKKWERERHLNKEARREKAIREALS